MNRQASSTATSPGTAGGEQSGPQTLYRIASSRPRKTVLLSEAGRKAAGGRGPRYVLVVQAIGCRGMQGHEVK
ncbi:hypothetical protein HXX76_008451 [Chlamydomonas incerta]|uniref:Uncharacterized protein n=1 Tax=Chlamydomonas incerta TaxID=51695 RepID=A0A835VXX4_CHLIN|nr:hypothetical protein HXX76_008451 [Chlamydomonas incerta]|eukprot:KAG2433392.1 hypothetical protein HXX76_008451 [Chlamydomonas incerta]